MIEVEKQPGETSLTPIVTRHAKLRWLERSPEGHEWPGDALRRAASRAHRVSLPKAGLGEAYRDPATDTLLLIRDGKIVTVLNDYEDVYRRDSRAGGLR